MKKLFLLFLLVAAGAARAQQLGVDYPELKLSSGRALTHTRVLNFDGGSFEIENVNGRTRIPWASMPADWQARFPLDLATAAKAAALRREITQLEDLEKTKRTTAAPTPAPPAVTVVPAQSKSPNEMELPRYNLQTLDDLKIGISAQKVIAILGHPLRVNGTQWVYPTGQIYVEDGVVTAMQNRAGGVFAADWKR